MDFTVLDKYNHMPANKLKAIELIATKGLEHDLSLNEIAAECNVSRKTLWSWRSEREFNDALMDMSKEMNRSMLPRVMARLSRDIDNASTRDITNIARLLFQLHGELTEKSELTVKEQVPDIDAILREVEKM